MVCLSVCLSCEPAKTAQPIEMPFGLRTRVGSRIRVLDGGPYPTIERGNFEGRPTAKYRDTAVTCAKNQSSCRLGYGLARNSLLDECSDAHGKG